MAEEIRLSKSFIETELPQAPPLYVSVYLGRMRRRWLNG